MILQRVSKNLIDRDWSLALVEILIVVVGIFIGLQVDDWNQARKDRIDEALSLERLHDDLLLADDLSRRLRQRRIDRLDAMLDAADVLFNRNERDSLTDKECGGIVWSTAFNIVASGLPSVDELLGTGRMGIIRNTELRTALVALRQTRSALDMTILEKTASFNFVNLPAAFPDLFRLAMYFDNTRGEVWTKNECDLTAMRANQPFLNQFSVNGDGYDAYVRDGVKPWSSQLDRVHELVDSALAFDHHADVSE